MKYIVYVCVGNLSTKNAEEYVSNYKDKFNSVNFFEITDKVVYIPIRNDDTRIEALPS